MAGYELISGIEVDRRLRAFVEEEALPGTGIEPAAFWFGFSALLRELTPENKRLLRRREDLQARIDERNAALGGPAARARRGRGVPARDRLSGRSAGALRDRHRGCRSGDRRDRRARSWSCRSTTPATPSTPPTPAGAASTTRSTAPTRSATGRAAGGYDPERGRAGDRLGPRLPRRDRAADRRQPCRRRQLRASRTAGWSTDRGDARATRRCSPAWRRRPSPLLRHHGLHVEIVDRPRPSDRPRRQGRASPTSCSKARSPRSWTARIRSPRSTPRRRSRSTATGSA